MTAQARVKKELLRMLEDELTRRAIGQTAAAQPKVSEVRIYLPSNGRGDEFPPGQYEQWRELQDAVADILAEPEPKRSRLIEKVRRIAE